MTEIGSDNVIKTISLFYYCGFCNVKIYYKNVIYFILTKFHSFQKKCKINSARKKKKNLLKMHCLKEN